MHIQYDNPLIRQRADPFIYLHDGYYYFTASVPAYDLIELRRAKTIQGLREAAPVSIWKRHTEGEMSCLIWAPEIHFIDGQWVVYFAAGHTEEVLDHRIYVLTCDTANPLEGVFVERGRIDTGNDAFALDATAFSHDGVQYLVWGQQDAAIEGHSNIYLAKMKNPWTLGCSPVMLSIPKYSWERRGFAVNEGPAVIKRNGRVFITYSASGVDRNYCMGLLWADLSADLLNVCSWKKSDQPVFVTSDENRQYGPGHNSFTVAEDGKTDLLVYHAREYETIEGDPLYDPNRHTRIQPFYWDACGMPVFGVPAANGPLIL